MVERLPGGRQGSRCQGEGDRAVFGDKAYVNEKKKRVARSVGVYWAVKE